MVQSLNFGGITTFFKLLTRPKLFLPHLILDDIRKVDFKLLKDSGFKAVVFDKDNTLTAPYKLILHPPFLDSWLQCKTVFGPNVLVVSNSAGTPDDKTNEAFRIEKELGVKVLKHATKKPLGGEELPAFFNCRASEIVIIGDRLTTDIVYGRLIGAFTILCRKIVTEQGDNLMAKYLRRIEHYYLGLAINHGVPLPKHFKQ